MCYTNTRAAEFNKVSLQSLSLNQILNKVFMQTFVLCLEVRDGKQETREWGVADLTGSKDGERDAGGLEGSTSLRFSSSSSPSLQSAPDRRSLIGNEPWSRSLSRDQQIATTYRLWRGDSSTPPPISISLSSLRLSLSLHPSLPVFMGSLWFIQGSVGVRATESRGVFYCSWCVKRPTYSVPARACPDMPGLTNPPGVVMFTPLHGQCLHLSITASAHILINGWM